jgi:hypothetical protein
LILKGDLKGSEKTRVNPFSPRWYSHKLNGPGLKRCGSNSDLNLAREILQKNGLTKMSEDEKII